METKEDAAQPAPDDPGLRAYPVLLLLYLGIMGGAYAAFEDQLQGTIRALSEFTARVVYYAIWAFAEKLSVRDTVLTLDGFSVSIVIECVGLLEMIIFSACVLAYPSTWPSKLLGIAAGCGAIFLFNVVRIAMLLVVGRYQHDYFEFFHIYFWQATMIAMIATVWMGWLRWFVRR